MKEISWKKYSLILSLVIIIVFSLALQAFISPGQNASSSFVQEAADPTPTVYPTSDPIAPQDHAPGIIIAGIAILVIILGGYLLRGGVKKTTKGNKPDHNETGL
jgi:hypothetical protein